MTDVAKATAPVAGIANIDGKLRVTFEGYDCYFTLCAEADTQTQLQQLQQAMAQQREVTFTYDRHLCIHEIL